MKEWGWDSVMSIPTVDYEALKTVNALYGYIPVKFVLDLAGEEGVTYLKYLRATQDYRYNRQPYTDVSDEYLAAINILRNTEMKTVSWIGLELREE